MWILVYALVGWRTRCRRPGCLNRACASRDCVTLTLGRRAISVRLAGCGTSIRDIAVKKRQQKLTKGQIAMTVAAVLIIASMVLGGVASVFNSGF